MNPMITRTVVKTTVAAALAASAMLSLSANADNDEVIEVDKAIERLDEVIDRVKPVGHLVILESNAAVAPATAAPAAETTSTTADAGKATYDTSCFACHGTGAAGAPILGNKDAWAPRLGQGIDTLYSHAINGFKGMPPKGGAASLSDEQIKAVVDYMVGQSS